MKLFTFIAAALLPLVGLATAARTDIFQWEYTNAADTCSPAQSQPSPRGFLTAT
jgi:hypothetical protein